MRWSYLLFFLPALLLLIGFFHHITAYDQDLGRHILTGEIIAKTLHIPVTNLFSYTFPTFPFINHHWGAEVIFYFITTFAGNMGLFILSLFVIFTACFLFFFEGQKKTQVVPTAFLSLVYLRILFERTDLRPELFSFLFLAIIVFILYRYRERFTNLIFLLPLIQLLWTNTHIYFPIGILITSLFIIDEVITHRKKLLNAHTKTLVGIFLGMGVLTLFNPHFLTGALYPLHVFQNYGYTIEENQTPFFLQSLGFTKPSFLYLEIAVVLLFISLACSWKKTKPIDWLLAIVFTLISLSAVRNFPLFVFATFIPCARAFSESLTPLFSFLSRKPPVWITTILIILVIFFSWQVHTVLGLGRFGYGVDIGGEKALDFFQQQHIHGPIFNNFDIGSYIESRLYPEEKVFIDGRPEAYPASFIQNTYEKMQQDPIFFNEVSEHYHFNAIIFSHTDQTPWAESFMNTIIRNPDWRTVYLDPTMIILLKNNSQNHALITEFGMQNEHITMNLPNDNILIRQAAHFYSVANLSKQLEATLLRLVTINPTDCSSLGVLASLYSQTQNPASSIYQTKYQTQCAR
ncbi:hypothetical protein BH09PAT1_BH09PAT1_0320 [soil metagenome]